MITSRRMSMSLLILFALVLAAIPVLRAESSDAWGKTGLGKYQEVSALRTLSENPRKFHSKIVSVKGTISEECPSGCTFTLQDATGSLFVDLNPYGFIIPQIAGKHVRVLGKFVNAKTGARLNGGRVELVKE